MLRRKNSFSVRREVNRAEEELNPNSYISNLADCMLVLAVGLIVALITSYNVDLAETGEASYANEVIIYTEGKDPNGEDLYEDMGTIYRDKVTGQLYMVKNEGMTLEMETSE